jgi:murein DD-endopeptidase MepM/ murein hydrolase activator NlpD
MNHVPIAPTAPTKRLRRTPLPPLATAIACALLVIVVAARNVETPRLPLLPVPLVFDLIRERAADDRNLPSTEEIVERLSHLVTPIAGARPSSKDSHLPGAARPYRGGSHEGLDYYAWYCGINVVYGHPVRAAAPGLVIRADHDFAELTPESRPFAVRAAQLAGDTDPRVLDPLHGRQVWLLHDGGIMTRYTHLAAIPAGIARGMHVSARQVIGMTGNSGTSQGALGTQVDPHLHFEVYIDWRLWQQGLTGEQIRQVLRLILRRE